MNCDNDVYSPDFESKVDPYFTSALEADRWGKYNRWDKSDVRSALTTTKPIKPPRYQTQGILGVSSPNRKRD